MAKTVPNKTSFLDRFDLFLGNNSILFLAVIFILFTLLTLMNFDTKLSIQNDDALYMQSAYKYATDFTNFYHNANAPFYPMFMSLFVVFFGLNLTILKICSSIFMLLSLLFFYKAFKNRVPNLILFSALAVTAFSPIILYFSHHTFTEAFILMLQSLFFISCFKIHDSIFIKDTDPPIKDWLLFGGMLFIISLTKTLLYTAIPISIVFFLIYKKYKASLYTLVSFAFFQILYSLSKLIIWSGVEGLNSSQYHIILRKDPYNASKGMEDFGGYVQRFIDNIQLYVSKRLYDIMSITPDSKETSFGLLLITFILLGITLYWVFKNKDKKVFYVALYVSGLITALSISLQVRWDQPRMVMIYLPLIIILLLYGVYSFLNKKNVLGLNMLFILVSIILLPALGLTRSFNKGQKNMKTIRKNLKGELYYGYTLDWMNYIKMSEWAAQEGNLPEGSYVACRKPPFSFVYSGGMSFHGIYNADPQDADILLNKLKEKNVTHVIMANLRMNPKKKTKYTITSVRRYLYCIQKKYPRIIQKVHQIGDSGNEEAILFKINYNNVTN